MSLFVDLTLNGFTYGVIYAAVALGLVLVWRATRVDQLRGKAHLRPSPPT